MEIKVADNNILYNQCLEIRKRVFVEEQNVPMDREVDEYEDTATHILLIDDEPIGTVRYRPASDDMIKIERMAVLPEERGRKLGFKLMEFVHQHAREAGYTRTKPVRRCMRSTSTRSSDTPSPPMNSRMRAFRTSIWRRICRQQFAPAIWWVFYYGLGVDMCTWYNEYAK